MNEDKYNIQKNQQNHCGGIENLKIFFNIWQIFWILIFFSFSFKINMIKLKKDPKFLCENVRKIKRKNNETWKNLVEEW